MLSMLAGVAPYRHGPKAGGSGRQRQKQRELLDVVDVGKRGGGALMFAAKHWPKLNPSPGFSPPGSAAHLKNEAECQSQAEPGTNILEPSINHQDQHSSALHNAVLDIRPPLEGTKTNNEHTLGNMECIFIVHPGGRVATTYPGGHVATVHPGERVGIVHTGGELEYVSDARLAELLRQGRVKLAFSTPTPPKRSLRGRGIGRPPASPPAKTEKTRSPPAKVKETRRPPVKIKNATTSTGYATRSRTSTATNLSASTPRAQAKATMPTGFESATAPPQNAEPGGEDDNEEQDRGGGKQWKVHRLLNDKWVMKKRRRCHYYLIEWVGDYKPTWERAGNIASDLKEEYNAQCDKPRLLTS
ncbi:hypothetical protein V496_02445 [Pseudogymnoascus sp. VKM F-4515 (FW-2607)]|nr:hypothetical protein V496_02445 [Pseudogymnoascus sp. VKM F-4515 (FW-2607)]